MAKVIALSCQDMVITFGKHGGTGMHLGRPIATYPDNWGNVYNQWKAKQITAKMAMELLEMKRTTFYKLVKQYSSGK